MKNINPLGLFDDHFLLEKLTKLGDPLQKLNEFIDWKIFESPINETFKNEDRDLSRGGRLPFNQSYCSKPLSFKVCITFLMINWNIKLLTEQVLNVFGIKEKRQGA